MGSALVVQRIGHIPSKDTMLVRFQPRVPDYGRVAEWLMALVLKTRE